MTAVLLVSVATGCGRVREADSEYDKALAQIDEIEELLEQNEFYALSPDQLSWLEREFETLEARLDNLQDLSSLPLGLDEVLGDEDRGSSRYRAVMVTLEVARMLAESGRMIAGIGHDTLVAFEDTGIRAEPGVDRDTWLDVLHGRESELNEALVIMEDALALRETIDEDDLPGRFRSHLRRIDAMTERISSQRELAHKAPLAFTTLGADDPVRYLVLLQNPAESRPTGGFIGTVAFVEIERGQVVSQEFADVYELSVDYQENVVEPIDPPWGLAEYVRPDSLQYQDANWWADFPVSARNYIDMTEIAGWPEVDSVVAVQPEAVTNLLSVTGPITVLIDGEQRAITEENLHDEAERQRRIAREGEATETGHKEVIALIGEVMLDHLAEREREDWIDAAFLMFDALDRRDMQAYHPDEDVQEFLEERNWAGRLQPIPDTATLATVYANVTGLKTSLAMQPEMHLDLSDVDEDGARDARLTLSLWHLGEEEEDPFYEGFQRWWLDVVLPDGSELIETTPEPAGDPDASNGGAYVLDLDVGDRRDVTVDFRMPETERLLIRRQPGLLNTDVTVEQTGCTQALEFELDRDIDLVFDEDCPLVDGGDDDESE